MGEAGASSNDEGAGAGGRPGLQVHRGAAELAASLQEHSVRRRDLMAPARVVLAEVSASLDLEHDDEQKVLERILTSAGRTLLSRRVARGADPEIASAALLVALQQDLR